MTDKMMNLSQMSNIGVPGQFVFRLDEREIDIASEYIHDQFVFRIENKMINTLNHCVINIVFSHYLTLRGVNLHVLYL